MADSSFQHLQTASNERYRVERELGRGGMATVYLAQDLKLQRQVALKVLRPELAATVGPDRFHREIAIAARLNHPHILPLYDSGEIGGHLYYAMPYVEGESLRQRLEREGQLPVPEVIAIVQAVASALTYAHHAGVIHRDIKPENILLAGDASGGPVHPLVADFGIARALDAAGGERLTETGLALGTPAYMSPEQSAADGRLDGRSDIYALGCVAYEMLAGQPPFVGPTAHAILARHAVDPVPSLHTVRGTVPPAVEAGIERALAKVPADRFPTAAQFASALEAHVGEQPSHIRPTAVNTRRRRSKWIGLAALTGLAALGVDLWRSRGPPERPLDANLVAIAPFDVLDPSLQLWREGLVDILSRNLDGAGPLRTVPQTVGLKRWSGRADRASAEKFGRRTNAGLVVFGSMVRKARDSVSLRATVLDLTGRKSEPDLEVRGDTAMMGDLADSLGVRILQALGRNRPIGSVRQVSIGSRSLPALKAFLYGEQFYRKGLWDSALVYYDQAITRDSMFALALARMSIVLRWSPPTYRTYRPEDEYSRRAVRLNHGLSPKDSMLLGADSLDLAAGDATNPAEAIRFGFRRMATLEETAVRFPADPEVWYAVGEERYHNPSPMVGETPRPPLDAFDRAIALDSGFAPAYEHTVQLAMKLNRPDLARRYAAAYLRSDPADANAPYTHLAVLLLDPERSHAPETARLIDTIPGNALFRAGLEHLGYWADSAETAVRLLRALAGQRHRFPDPDDFVADTLMQRQFLAHVLSYRGHLHQAYATDQPLLLDPAASRASAWLDPFLSLSLLGVIPDSLAAAHFGGPSAQGKRGGSFASPPPGNSRDCRGGCHGEIRFHSPGSRAGRRRRPQDRRPHAADYRLSISGQRRRHISLSREATLPKQHVCSRRYRTPSAWPAIASTNSSSSPDYWPLRAEIEKPEMCWNGGPGLARVPSSAWQCWNAVALPRDWVTLQRRWRVTNSSPTFGVMPIRSCSLTSLRLAKVWLA